MVHAVYHQGMPKTIATGIIKRRNVYWFRTQKDGVRQQITLQTDDPAVAMERVALIKTSGSLEVRTDFDAEVATFLAEKRAMGKHTERSTGWFKETLTPFSKFIGNKPCAKVTEKEIELFYAHMRTHLADTTAKGRMGAIRSFFSWAKKTRRRFDNPTSEIKNPRISQPARTIYATKEQRDAIIAAASDDFDLKFMLLCAFHAGMRLNEISEARWDWFTVTGGSGFVMIQQTDTFIPKNKRNRTVPLTNTFRNFLLENGVTSQTGFVLRPNKTRTHKYRVCVRSPWGSHMGKCGFKYSPHVGRHTFASLLAQSGQIGMHKIAEWLGDTLEVTTKHYAHLAPHDNSINLID
jgi:integrase